MRSKMQSSSCQKYGVPLYGASWAPRCFKTDYFPWKSDNQGTDEISVEDSYLVLSGGGGEGRSGIPNAVLISRFDFASNSLSPKPVSEVGLGPELPYRMVIHPNGEGVLCSLPKSCMWLQWVSVQNSQVKLKMCETTLSAVDGIGQQLAMAFNHDGSILALGGEDGELRVVNWRTTESIFEKRSLYTSIKDLDFSPDGNYLASLGNGGPCRIWDVHSSTVVVSLVQEKDEVFANCRFSRITDGDEFFYVTVMQGHGAKIAKWKTGSWERTNSGVLVRDSLSAFNISPDGKLLAMGTVEGDIFIVNSISMKVESVVRNAHLGLVTSLAFSQNSSRALVSVSMDSSVRVTPITKQKDRGLQLWLVIFVALIAIILYFSEFGKSLQHPGLHYFPSST